MVALIKDFCSEKRIKPSFNDIVIKSTDDIQKHQFIGSPSIRINNLDVDPEARDINDFGFS